MYKTIEIKDIIGSFCDIMSCQLCIDMSDVREVMKIVTEEDNFITTVFTHKAICRVNELMGKDVDDSSNLISSDEAIRNEFIREYYRVDTSTRTIVSEVIRKYIVDERL
ncbi:hypothetical protein [uncultured Prevotella sp.]|uniref:hypothetical protein n=1 Tax=uncultured Prevotella sp. TaxID=159272 RepID=UPI002629C649|nr:hypothetical protein [uncultured Prevotella sp.]